MKLQFKPIFWLLGALLVVFVLSVVFQQYRAFSGLKQLYVQNLAVLEDREWLNAENVNQSVQHSVSGSLERGEMAKFTKLLAAQREIKGLLEFSLYDRQGVLTHSSDATTQTKALPAELRTGLLTNSAKVKRLTEQAFEIYQPQTIQPDCLRCHTDWPQSGGAGVMALRFSTASLTQAKQGWAATVGQLRKRQMIEAGVAAVIVSVCFFGLTVFVVRTRIAGPLSQAIKLTSHAAEQIASSTSLLISASQSVAEGASQQAASLEETSASLEEMSSMTRRNSDTAGKVKSLGAQACQSGDAGLRDMADMTVAMQAIKTSSGDTQKIIKTIDEIAFQTNILALNAAVEAARAGAAGAGFAIVTDEVRRLAQRCAEAAKETAARVEDAVQKTAKGAELSAKVARSLEEIVTQARHVDALAGEVSNASQEQSHGVEQVNLAVAEMDKVTQNNAASAEESASAAEELNAQAQALKEAVAELHKLVGDEAIPGAAPGTPARSAASGKPLPRGQAGAGAAMRNQSPAGGLEIQAAHSGNGRCHRQGTGHLPARS